MRIWMWSLSLVLLVGGTAYGQIPAMRIDGGFNITPMNDVTVTSSATLVHAADSARVTLSCTNTDASVNVRWGDSNVTATKGQQLPAGASIEIRNIDAVYMISEGTDVTVSCTKETY